MSKNYNSIRINGRSGSNSNSSNYEGNSYPSGSDRGGNRGYSSGGSNNQNNTGCTSSGSSAELSLGSYYTAYIQKYNFQSGQLLGGAYHDQRKSKDRNDGINYQAKSVVSLAKYYGVASTRAIMLRDCDINDNDTSYSYLSN